MTASSHGRAQESAAGQSAVSSPRDHAKNAWGRLATVAVGATFAFAFWTMACHVCVIFHLSFVALSRIGPFALAVGLACGILVSRFRRYPVEPRAQEAAIAQPVSWIPIAVAAALVLAYRLGAGYSAFWIGCVVLLVVGLAKSAGSYALQFPISSSRGQKVLLLCMVVVAPLLTYLAHRPDIDDAVYVGTAADAVAHPQLPVLSHDVIYGDGKLPPMLPSYAVESYELLIGLLARLFGGQPIFWAHAVVPTALAALLPIAWAMLMRILSPKHWVAATLFSLIALSLATDFRGFGNFAFVRLFQGKAILVSIGLPLLFSVAWQYEETGSIWDWTKIAAGTISCVGVSASAIFVSPLALAIAALAGWRRGLSKRALIAFLPSAYPLGCGLAVSHGFGQLQKAFAQLPARASFAVMGVFAVHTQYIFLLGLIVAPFLTRNRGLRRLLAVVVLAYFLIALNPFTFKFLSRFTTRDAVWRLLWCVPVAGIVATSCVNAFQTVYEKWGKRGSACAVIVLVAGLVYLAPYSSLSPSNGVSYSFHPLKVTDPDYEIARQIIAATPSGTTALAPENLAVWIATFVHRVPLVSVREIYDAEMGAHLASDDANTRRELRELISGRSASERESALLLQQLHRYDVGLVVTPSSVGSRLERLLAYYGFALTQQRHGYDFFSRS